MAIAPWIGVDRPNYLQAMQSGAGIGLSLRGQDIAEQEAGDRLRESYAHLSSQGDISRNQLAAQQSMANARIASAERQHAAALALRQSQMEGLQDYRESMLGVRNQGLDLRQEQIDNMLKARDEAAKQAGQRETDRQAQRDFMNELRSRGLDLREQGLDRQKPVTTKLEADDYGPALSGPIDSPEITKRLKQRSDALLAKQNAPGLFDRIKSSLFGSPAPVGVSPLTPLSTGSTNTSTAQRAHAAIAAGADPDAVKDRYKKLTGEDLE